MTDFGTAALAPQPVAVGGGGFADALDAIDLRVVWGGIVVNGGAGETSDPLLDLTLSPSSSAAAVTSASYSADGGASWTAWEAPLTQRSLAVTQQEFPSELLTVCVRWRDAAENTSPPICAAIRLNAEPPPIETWVGEPVQRITSVCELFLGDTSLGTVSITAGSVTADARRAELRDAQIEVAPDEQRTLAELFRLFLVPGVEVQLARGFRELHAATYGASGTSSLAPLGRFIVDAAEYTRAHGGGGLYVTLADLAVRITRNRWPDPWQITKGTGLAQAVLEIIEDRWPDVRSAIDPEVVPDVTSAQAVFEGGADSDPWADLVGLCEAHGWAIYFDPLGIARMRVLPDLATASPAWIFSRGETAIITSLTRAAPQERSYNGVIATGEGTELAVPVRGEAWDDNPESPTYRYGPFGSVPRFYSSPLLTTVEMCETAARTMLSGLLGRTETLSWEQIVHPGLQPLDVVALETASGDLEMRIIDSVTVPLDAATPMSAEARDVVLPHAPYEITDEEDEGGGD